MKSQVKVKYDNIHKHHIIIIFIFMYYACIRRETVYLVFTFS